MSGRHLVLASLATHTKWMTMVGEERQAEKVIKRQKSVGGWVQDKLYGEAEEIKEEIRTSF